MGLSLNLEKLDIDPITRVSEEKWYTYADFSLSEMKKKWGLLPQKVTYTLDDLLLPVCSPSVNHADIDGAQESDMSKMLRLGKYDENMVKEYIAEKVDAASKMDTIEDAFNFLGKYFIIDDE